MEPFIFTLVILTLLLIIYFCAAIAFGVIVWDTPDIDSKIGHGVLTVIVGIFLFGLVCNVIKCYRQVDLVEGFVTKTPQKAIVEIGNKSYTVENIGFYNAVTNGVQTFKRVNYYNYYHGLISDEIYSR